MLDDFTPIVHKIGGQGIRIYPISDLHIGSKGFKEKQWLEFVERLKNEPNSYITIGGDMLNTALKNSKSNVYDDIMRPREQKDYLTRQLRPITDKILAIVPGNHEFRSAREVDDNPLYDVAVRLGIEHLYRENACFIKIQLGDVDRRGDSKYRPTYTGCIVHGVAGGRKVGSSINRNEEFASNFEGVDFFIMGHSHKPVSSKPEKIVFDSKNNMIRFRQTLVVVATSWVEYGDYALKGMMSPATFALQSIELSGYGKEMKYEY